MCIIRGDMDDDVTMTRLETHANDETKRRSTLGVVWHRKNAVYARRGHRSSRLVLYTPLGARPHQTLVRVWLGFRVHPTST